jgi:hypothetical protein
LQRDTLARAATFWMLRGTVLGDTWSVHAISRMLYP